MKVLKKEENQKGITLVALVVTIIILLILAGVTLNLALGNTGLFKKAQEAADRYKSASQNESDILDELDKTLEELEGGKVADRTGLEIGDTVNYTYDNATNYELLGKNSGYGDYENTDTGYELKTEKNQSIAQVKNAKWQVLSINSDGSVDLVCTSIARNGASYIQQFATGSNVEEGNASGGVIFGGAIGYTNGVYYLNDICAKQYSNKSLGVTARNIKIEDIDKHLNETGKTAKQEVISQIGTTEHTGNYTNYPKLYAFENGSGIDTDTLTTNGIGPSESKTSSLSIPMSHSDTEEGYTKAESKLKVECNFYYLDTSEDDYFDEKITEMLFGTNSGFWLASRFAVGDSNVADFGLRGVAVSNLYDGYLFSSDADYGSGGLFVCPVVSLGSNIQLVETENGVWDIQ